MNIPSTLVTITMTDNDNINNECRYVDSDTMSFFTECPRCSRAFFERARDNTEDEEMHICPECGYRYRRADKMRMYTVLRKIDSIREKVIRNFEALFPKVEPAYALAA